MATNTKNKKSGTINNPTGVYGSSKSKPKTTTTTTTVPVSAKIYTGYQSPKKSTSTTSKGSGSTSPSTTSADKGKAMGTYRAPQPTKSTTINNPTAVYGSSKPKTPTLSASAKIYTGYQSPSASKSTTEKWTPSIADKLKVKRVLDRITALANGVYIPPYKQQISKSSGTINNPTGVYGASQPKEEGSATASYYSKPTQPASEEKSKAMGTYRAPAFTEQSSYVSPYKKSGTQQLPHQIAANELHKILAEQKGSGTIHNPNAVYGQQTKEKQWLVDDLVREATKPSEYYDYNKVQQKAKAAGLDVDMFFDREAVVKELKNTPLASNDGITLAIAMFNHGKTGFGKEMPIGLKQYAAAKVATDKGFMRAVDDAVRDNAGSDSFVFDTKDYYSSENREKFGRKPFKLNDRDTWYALGTVDAVIQGKRSPDGRWLISYEVEDEYDFEQKTYTKEGINFSTSNIINDYGALMQNTGQLQNYHVQFSGGFLY